MRLSTLASTRSTFYGGIKESIRKEDILHSNFIQANSSDSRYTFPSLQPQLPSLSVTSAHQQNISTFSHWFPDGGSFLTVSEDLGIRIYITSSTLLEDVEEQLIPFIRTFQSFPFSAFELHPESSIYDGFCSCLISSQQSPLKFINLIPNDDTNTPLLKAFKTQDEHTEKYLKMTSIKFVDSSNFVAGSSGSIYLYDINRDSPIRKVSTKIGITSSLMPAKSDFLPSNSFYCSSFSNKIQLYSSEGSLITSKVSAGNGNGITQLIESVNGKLLFVIKRNSTAIDVLDLRMGLDKVGELMEFQSKNQRILGDVMPQSHGLMIGSSDGYLNWYKDAELGFSNQKPEKLARLSDSSISSVSINPIDSSISLYTTGDRSYNQPQVQINQIKS